jgi:hypothetical protein
MSIQDRLIPVCRWCDRKLLKIVENMASGLKERLSVSR